MGLNNCCSSQLSSAQFSKYETVSKKSSSVALGGGDAKLVFRKRVYRHVHDIPNDPIEYHLLYAEAVNKVVKVLNVCSRKLVYWYVLGILRDHLEYNLSGNIN